MQSGTSAGYSGVADSSQTQPHVVTSRRRSCITPTEERRERRKKRARTHHVCEINAVLLVVLAGHLLAEYAAVAKNTVHRLDDGPRSLEFQVARPVLPQSRLSSAESQQRRRRRPRTDGRTRLRGTGLQIAHPRVSVFWDCGEALTMAITPSLLSSALSPRKTSCVNSAAGTAPPVKTSCRM